MPARPDPVSVVHGRFRRRIRSEIAATLSRQPVGTATHEDAGDRTIHFLRSLPMEGKHMVFAVSAGGPWRVGRVCKGGGAGNFVLGPEEYLTYGAAVGAVFSERYAELLREKPT